MNDSQTVVVGVDGSPASVFALRWAADEAARLDLQVEAVFVAPRDGSRGSGPDPEVLLAATVDMAFSHSRAGLRQRVSERVVTGAPVDVLVERSRDAVFVVLGRTQGRDPLHMSTMSRCLRLAACPVVVIPATAAQPDTSEAVPAHATASYGSLDDRPVRDVMTHHVLGISPKTGVDVGLQVMVGAGIHHLPVIAHGRCIGLLYESNIVWRMSAWPFAERSPDAAAMARTPAPVVSASQPVSQAAAAMFECNGDAVVISDQEQVVGILTTADLVALLASRPQVGRQRDEGSVSEAASATRPEKGATRHG